MGGLGGYMVADKLGVDKTLATLTGMFGGGGLGFLMAQYVINKHNAGLHTPGAGASGTGPLVTVAPNPAAAPRE